jgi:hypothetical protein
MPKKLLKKGTSLYHEQEVVIGLDPLPVHLPFSEEWMGF